MWTRALPALALLACEAAAIDPLAPPDPRRGEGAGAAYVLVEVVGRGQVVSRESPPVIDCAPRCVGRYAAGSTLELVPTAPPGWIFSRFEGHDDCINGKLTALGERRCVARFVSTPEPRHTLTVEVRGEGSVIFESLRHKPGCEQACVRTFTKGSTVALSTAAFEGWRFARFEGDEDCRDGRLEMDGPRRCVAVFGVDPDALARLRIEIEGRGLVAVDNAETPDCGRSCVRSFFRGTRVTLAGVPDAERQTRFLGFSGDPGCAEGLVPMDVDRRCVARFGGGRKHLNLWVEGEGAVLAGTARCASPTDDNEHCSFAAQDGERLGLVPEPAPGWSFDRFTGDCSGSVVLMDRDRSCRARFVFAPTRCELADLTPPAPPDELRAVAQGCTQVGLTWGAASDVGCGVRLYEVERDGRVLARVGGNGWGEASWLRPNTRYRYRVRAIDGAGNASSAVSAEVVTPACAALPARIDTKLILAKFAELPVEPVTPAQADRQVFGPLGSLSAYMSEVSYGRTRLEGTTHGWYVMPAPIDRYCASWDREMGGMNCDLAAIHFDALRLADPEVDFTGVERIILVVNDLGDFAGAAGGLVTTDEGTIFPMVTIAGRSGYALNVLAHELGHTFDALHAARWDCDAAAVGAALDDPIAGGCRVVTYGDGLDTMGGGINHFSAFHKERLGLFDPANIGVAATSGFYELEALETPAAGVSYWKVPIEGEPLEGGDFYFLERRTPTGFDRLSVEGRGIDGVVVRLALGYPTTSSSDTLLPYEGWLVTPKTPFWDPYRGLLIESLEQGERISTLRITRGF